MVQEFHVVRCFSCLKFQSQQVCKKPKFACKICGEKQSVRKEYGRGNGKDCRIHVQKLNSLQGNLDLEEEKRIESQLENQVYGEQFARNTIDHYEESYGNNDEIVDSTSYTSGHISTGIVMENTAGQGSKSKWSTFLTKDEASNDPEDEVLPESALRQQQQFQKQSGSGSKRCFIKTPNLQKNNTRMKQESITSFMPLIKAHSSLGKSEIYLSDFDCSGVNQNEIAHSTNDRISASGKQKFVQESQVSEEIRMHSSMFSDVRNSKHEETYNQGIGKSPLESHQEVRQSSIQVKRALEKPQNSSIKRSTLRNVSFKEEYGSGSFCNRSDFSSNEVMKSITEESYRSDLQSSKSVFDDAKNIIENLSDSCNFRKQQALHACLKSSNNVAFKKYELANDNEDIDFDL